MLGRGLKLGAVGWYLCDVGESSLRVAFMDRLWNGY